MKQRVLLSWSSGKDSAWTLLRLQQDPEVEIAGLLTTVNAHHQRVAMHATRQTLLAAQARAAGLPLYTVPIPWPCRNEDYEQAMAAALGRARRDGVTHVAFGDLFLEDIRAYRERQMQGSGMTPLFPIWQEPTATLARAMIDSGMEAILTCVDPQRLPQDLLGRRFDHALLAELPAAVDPCGENGEFHTCVLAGPMFRQRLRARVGDRVRRDGFCFVDLLPEEAPTAASGD